MIILFLFWKHVGELSTMQVYPVPLPRPGEESPSDCWEKNLTVSGGSYRLAGM
jgi:hypothetical protein